MKKIDAIEVFNQHLNRKANLAALGWALQMQKGIIGGSDGHLLKRLGDGVTASKATTFEEHLKNIRKGKVEVHGKELSRPERLISFARTTVENKIRHGVRDGLRKLSNQFR